MEVIHTYIHTYVLRTFSLSHPIQDGPQKSWGAAARLHCSMAFPSLDRLVLGDSRLSSVSVISITFHCLKEFVLFLG